ncbi:glycoside hydrolase family 32 protein [Didymella exigua CBS 183.55]|uniref:Glycoside hydrolase family 32 protein n=1 Tax=Didymella exigua CBS 183.55 TaxID=1150837 RepID=A0A6A5RY81_9PLEO|nr:glycoside hydrolase family 32 protein [Didymella exigua CBS 183.55]KAF1933361.1 glycoside hydrolase family 32 protein [Didymella exigua CBS 183.55]
MRGMYKHASVALFAKLATGHIISHQASIDYAGAPPNLSTLANFSLFQTWRPRSHVLPAFGQIGDPCMHYTDPQTGLFHVGYLYNGTGASGATTEDFVTYTDLNNKSANFIVAGGKNDPVAVFDGSVIERGINGTPTLLYTSVSYLPIQWTVAYVKGSETQSLAIARDDGRNFTKLEHGPVIPSPPFAVNVTGFRDPFVFQNPQVDSLLKKTNGTEYTIISGGTHGGGPSLFLYAHYGDESDNFKTWEYIGEWWHEKANTTWTEAGWAGRWGFNFEVGNYFALDKDGYNPQGEIFTTVGAEWSFDPIVPQVSDNREMLWAAGKQSIVNGSIKFEPTMAGSLDAGRSAYAAAGKAVASSSRASQKSGAPDRFLTYLWLTGDFYGTLNTPKAQQNWTGSLLLPRELRVGCLNVIDNELARERGAWRIDAEHDNGTVTLATLHQKIAREPLAAFKSNANAVITQAGGLRSSGATFDRSPSSKHYVLSASITFPSRSNCTMAGLEILSGDLETTRIYYQFSNESLIVDRSRSSAAVATNDWVMTETESGKLRLFDVPGVIGTKVETLDLTIVVDGGIVEVHVNDRFALSTWIWSWYEDSKNIRFIAEGSEVEFGNVTIWEGLIDAWPERST